MSVTIYFDGWDKEPTKTVRLIDLYDSLDNSDFAECGYDVDDQGCFVITESTAPTLNLANGNFVRLCKEMFYLSAGCEESSLCGELDATDTRVFRAHLIARMNQPMDLWLKSYLDKLKIILDKAVERNVGIYWS